MAAFRIITLILALLTGGYVYYFAGRCMKFWGLDQKKRLSGAIRFLLAVLAVYFCRSLRNTEALVFLHVIIISLLLDIAAWIIGRCFAGREPGRCLRGWKKVYGCGLLPVFLAGIIIIYGVGNMKRVIKTEYEVETDKNTGNYRIVLITDTHYDTIQDTGILKEKVGEINALEPDVVILGGDIVEEGTSKEAMQEVFQVLGSLQTQYGIYYVYGNHDRQPYTSNRSYTGEELGRAITDSGIRILEDDYVEINDDLVIAGRGDAAWGNVSGRASSEEILQDVDREKYIVMVDHQPIGMEENDAVGVDLELSGHTHGGQIWPVGHFTELLGGLNYGEYQVGNCRVIVSSGFTGWGYPVRTQEHCEYVVVNIHGAGAEQ